MHRNAVSDLMVWLDKADLINVLRDDVEGYKLRFPMKNLT